MRVHLSDLELHMYVAIHEFGTTACTQVNDEYFSRLNILKSTAITKNFFVLETHYTAVSISFIVQSRTAFTFDVDSIMNNTLEYILSDSISNDASIRSNIFISLLVFQPSCEL